MDVILGIVIIVGVVAAFVAPMCYCKQGTRTHEIINEKHNAATATGSPTVQIKIVHPYHDRCLNTVSPMYNPNHIIVKKDNTIMTKDELNASKIEIQRNMTPLKLPWTRRMFHKPCFSMKNSETVDSNDCREYVGNSSTEPGSFSGTKIVSVDVHAKNSPSVNGESRNSIERKPTQTGIHCDVKSRKLLTTVSEKLKKFGKTLSHSRSRSTSFQIINETDETDRLSIPTFCCRSSVDQSMFHRRQMVDVSTSTQISSNVQNSNESNEVVSRNDSTKTMKTSFDSNKEPNNNQGSDAQMLQDISLLINSLSHLQEQQSVNERSICNVQITGLVLNRSKLLDLLRANDRKLRSMSIISADNASTISIKFYGHRRRSEPKIPEGVGLLYECPLKRLYKSLPGRSEKTKLTGNFPSEERSNKCSSKEISSSSKDESLYEDILEVEEAIIADENLFMEKKTLAERLRERFCNLFC